MRPRKFLIAYVALCCAQLAGAACADELWRLPSELCVALHYSPLEDRLFEQAQRGQFADERLLTAAFVAGGVADEPTLAAYLGRYRTWVVRLRQATRAGKADEPLGAPRSGQPAAAAFQFMHQEILTGKYDVQCSRMTEVFDTGNYNCVTATILFNSLAREIGLASCGGESPSHVVSLLRTPQTVLEVETTCPRWFERTRTQQSSVAHQSLSLLPPAESRRPAIRRELNAVELTAIVYYNVGVDLAEQRRYAEAVAANYKALRLDSQCQNARGNLLAAINNWALDLAEREQFAQAIELIRHGRRLAPDHKTFAPNDSAIHQRWVQQLCERGQHAQAAAILERAAQEHPEDPYFSSARQELQQRANAAGP